MPNIPTPAEVPEKEAISFDLSDMEPYREFQVLLHNDDEHDMHDVTVQIMRALGCGVERAQAIMLTAHNQGRATVIIAAESRARRVASVLREIDLKVTIRPIN